MKVAYLSLMSPPGHAAVSGVPKVSETLLREFETLPDLQVEVVTLVDGLEAETSFEKGHVHYHYLPCKPRGKTATFYWQESRLLKKRVLDLGVDLVHGQPTGEYLLAATGCGLPNVITIHGLIMRETAGLSVLQEGFLAGLIREFLQCRAARRATDIISISPYVEHYLRGWTPGQIWPIANPIEEDFFQIPEPDRTGLRILCVGIVSERKNQVLLVEACHQLAIAGIPFECRIVGKTAPGYEEKIRATIREAGLTDRVAVTGMVSHEELIRSYAWANVVVLPSLEETSPLSLIQGMACGRAVFGADAAGIPDLLKEGSLGTLFSTASAEMLADELKAFARDPGPFWEKAKAAQERARIAFEPFAVARRTVEVYEAILGRSA